MAQETNKQPAGKRKLLPDNLPGTGNDPDKKKNKFSVYWVYGIILLVIILWNVMRTVSTAGIEVNQGYLTQLIKAGDVIEDRSTESDKTGLVVVRNKNIARMFLNKDSVAKKESFYKSFLSEEKYTLLKKSLAPQVYFNIAKDADLEKSLKEY